MKRECQISQAGQMEKKKYEHRSNCLVKFIMKVHSDANFRSPLHLRSEDQIQN